MPGVYYYAIYCCSSLRPTAGVTLHRSNNGGKTMYQLFFKIGWKMKVTATGLKQSVKDENLKRQTKNWTLYTCRLSLLMVN